MKILVTGASGFIGTALVRHLAANGHEPLPLGRSRSTANAVVWNPETGEIEAEKLTGTDAVIHLAGENIAAGRWTAAKKQRLIDSRLKGTHLIAETISKWRGHRAR